jgi:hypothetical protein
MHSDLREKVSGIKGKRPLDRPRRRWEDDNEIYIKDGSRDRVVGVLPGLCAGQPRTRGSLPGEATDLRISKAPTPTLGPTKPPNQWVPGGGGGGDGKGRSPEEKRLWPEDDHFRLVRRLRTNGGTAFMAYTGTSISLVFTTG